MKNINTLSLITELRNCVERDKYKVVVVSDSKEKMKECFRDIIELAEEDPGTCDKITKRQYGINTSYIEFCNGSYIKVIPFTSESQIRGVRADCVLASERLQSDSHANCCLRKIEVRIPIWRCKK